MSTSVQPETLYGQTSEWVAPIQKPEMDQPVNSHANAMRHTLTN